MSAAVPAPLKKESPGGRRLCTSRYDKAPKFACMQKKKKVYVHVSQEKLIYISVFQKTEKYACISLKLICI